MSVKGINTGQKVKLKVESLKKGKPEFQRAKVKEYQTAQTKGLKYMFSPKF